MTTLNIATTLPTGTFHKRQTGLWGQLRASVEIEAKEARLAPLFKELHGRSLNRTAFYGKCRELARESKEDVGGYLQYTTQAIAGVVLGEMHTRIGKEVRRNRTLKNEILKRTNVVFELGSVVFDTSEFVKATTGKRCVDGFVTKDSKTYKLYEALLKRKYPVAKATLMKEADIESVYHFYTVIRTLKDKGFDINIQRGNRGGIATKYSLVA